MTKINPDKTGRKQTQGPPGSREANTQTPLPLPYPDISECAVFILFTMRGAACSRHLPF